MCEMFSTELKFASDCLLGWFNKKHKSANLELSNEVKKQYEKENPIIWKRDKLCVCTFLLEISPTAPVLKVMIKCHTVIFVYLKNTNS